MGAPIIWKSVKPHGCRDPKGLDFAFKPWHDLGSGLQNSSCNSRIFISTFSRVFTGVWEQGSHSKLNLMEKCGPSETSPDYIGRVLFWKSQALDCSKIKWNSGYYSRKISRLCLWAPTTWGRAARKESEHWLQEECLGQHSQHRREVWGELRGLRDQSLLGKSNLSWK